MLIINHRSSMQVKSLIKAYDCAANTSIDQHVKPGVSLVMTDTLYLIVWSMGLMMMYT